MNKKTKTGIIIGTIVAGIVGAGFLGGQKVIDIINDNNGSNNGNLIVLNSVQNISFDEDSKTLHFIGVEDATNYEVTMKNLNLDKEYTYTTPVGSVQVDFPMNSLTGHTLKFSVVSKGDYVTTKDSESAVYNYTLQHETERLYNSYTENFYNRIFSSINNAIRGGDVKLDSIDSIDFKEGTYFVKGSARNYQDKDLYFTLSTTPTEAPNDFTLLSTLGNLSASIGARRNIDVTYTEGMVDVTSGLSVGESNTFKQYTDQGYYINTLQQTNSNFTNLGNGARSFTVNGVYQAISQGDEKITFEANHTITMQDNAEFTIPNHYFDYFNETGDAVIDDGEVTIYNADLMNHLEIMQQVHEEQVNQASQESAFEF